METETNAAVLARMEQQIVDCPAGLTMAHRVLSDLGRSEDSALRYTARMLTVGEAAAALTARGWTWADVLRRES